MENKKLHTIKSAGFKTSDSYFESFDDKLKARLTETQLIKNIDTPGFKVPDNYFENLDEKVVNRLNEDQPVITLKSRRHLYYIAGVAASLILMFNVYLSSETISINDIETVSIENYLEEGDFTSSDLAALLTEDELNKNNFIENEISESTIEDYLFDTIEFEDLILE
ncbi:hypothetical protein [Psychroserpens ponticola]|uniref:Uncharacterized protein n=1 Tax=Psychroserpens ponticola TaxID=2932268 RepID=A0ABY7RUZ9_9FLAO|nr:hypothetical protein [Psychroserpens ponticola]WCO00643.1 hypothetical protein MUN68_011255 [Psychroserpens ponticola]